MVWLMGIAIVATATSCSSVVDGKAQIEQLQVGAVQWGKCKVNGSDANDLPPGTECGKLGVPVNYADPDNPTPSQGAAQTGEIIAEMCDRMGGNAIGASVILGFDDPGETSIGDRAYVEVVAKLDTLTGFLDFALGDLDISDRISFRLERDVDWVATDADGDLCPA